MATKTASNKCVKDTIAACVTAIRKLKTDRIKKKKSATSKTTAGRRSKRSKTKKAKNA